jgi:hypothetical protein
MQIARKGGKPYQSRKPSAPCETSRLIRGGFSLGGLEHSFARDGLGLFCNMGIVGVEAKLGMTSHRTHFWIGHRRVQAVGKSAGTGDKNPKS